MCHFIEKVECVGKEKTKQAKSEPCQRLPFYGKSAIMPHISKEEDVAMAEKIKPLIVALDTNVFDNANYFYDGLDLDILKQYIDDGVIGKLIISDVVVRECKRHLSETAENLAEDFATKFDSLDWKRVSTIGALPSIPGLIDKDAMSAGLIKMYDEYLAATHAEIVDSKSVDIEKVISDYFNEVPPFKGGKKTGKKKDHKKYEFPDAIIIARLKQVAEEYGELRVVSDDADWKAAFWGNEKVKFYKEIKELFADITLEEKVGTRAIKYFNEHQVQFNNRIEQMLRTKPVEVYAQVRDRHGEEHKEAYDDFEILNIGVSSKITNVDYVGKLTVIITATVYALFELEGMFFNEVYPEPVGWGYESSELYIEMAGKAKEFHQIKFPVQVTYVIKEEKISKMVKADPQLPRKLVLDEGTVEDRRFIDTEGFSTYKKEYQCECGHNFIVDLMEHVDTTYPDGERGMGSELDHYIHCTDKCPNCGRHYIISGDVYEYPVGMLSLDDTKIEWKNTKKDK